MEHRIKYTKFRLSNHNLMIEKGRYMGIKSKERVCPFCTYGVEDEIHFLLDCYLYSAIRDTFLRKVDRENFFFKFLLREQKFWYLMTNFPHEASDFIFKSFELRDFLLQFPKRYD